MSKKTIFALGLILVRLIYLGFPNLFPEEAYYWNYAMHPAFGYLDHPPMVAWLIRLGTTLFGNTEFGVRIFALVCSLASAFFMFRLTALLYDRVAARTSFLILQVLPVFFLTGFMMTPDAPLIACWSASLYFLGRVLFGGRSCAWIGFGISLGLGMLSKYTVALLVPSLFVFMVLDPQSRVWFRRFQPWLAGLIAALLFSPVLFWNSRHAWVSFAFQTTDRMSAHRQFALHQLLLSILALLTPVGVILAVRILTAWKRQAPCDEPARTEWSRALFAQVFTLVPLSVFVIFSLTHKVKLNWTAPVWLALVPALAAFLVALPAGSGLRRGWTVTVGVFAALYIGFLHYLTTGIPGIGYASKIELVPVGWSELGRALDSRKESLKQFTGGAVRIVGMDKNFIASEAAFYAKNQSVAVKETTGVHLFGGNSLMYRFWSPSVEQNGATLLLVALKKSDLGSPKIARLSKPAGPVEELWLERNGKKICRYYVQVVSNYR
ncbi:MAG: glycosyltransferase family 39 protein, partial [Verrucomicrobiota bacterium]